MNDFDKTLTPEERAAPTFTEWSDATPFEMPRGWGEMKEGEK